MPLPIDNVQPGAGKETIRRAIQDSIKACLDKNEGSSEQCSGKVYGMARDKGLIE